MVLSATGKGPQAPEQDPQEVTLGGLLRRARQRRNLRLHHLAGSLGLSESMLSKIELGQRPTPLNAEFYDRLAALTAMGFSKQEIDEMLAVAPRVLRLAKEDPVAADARKPIAIPIGPNATLHVTPPDGIESAADLQAWIRQIGQMLITLADLNLAKNGNVPASGSGPTAQYYPQSAPS